jgi:hypothetical protein
MDSYSYEPPPNRRQKESRMARKLSKALADKHEPHLFFNSILFFINFKHLVLFGFSSRLRRHK